MSDFLALWHSPTTLVFLVGSAGLLVFYRLTNMTVSLKYSAKTHAPEPSATELAEIRAAEAEHRAKLGLEKS